MHGEIFEHLPRREAMRAAILVAHLSRDGEYGVKDEVPASASPGPKPAAPGPAKDLSDRASVEA